MILEKKTRGLISIFDGWRLKTAARNRCGRKKAASDDWPKPILNSGPCYADKRCMMAETVKEAGGDQPAATNVRKKILVVDDDWMIRKLLSEELESKGYQVSTGIDCSQAVSAVREQKPDLILLDILFPPDVGHGGGAAWDGISIMVWLRRMDEARETPFIIISGADPAVWEDRVLAAGAAAFFPKPIDYEELLHAIRNLLGEDAGEGPP
jgi:CheY-like chemotaxis protein